MQAGSAPAPGMVCGEGERAHRRRMGAGCKPALRAAGPAGPCAAHLAAPGWRRCFQSGQRSEAASAGRGQAIADGGPFLASGRQLRMAAAHALSSRLASPLQHSCPTLRRTCPAQSVAASSGPSASSKAAMHSSCPLQGLQARCSGVAPSRSSAQAQAPNASSPCSAAFWPFRAATASGVLHQGGGRQGSWRRVGARQSPPEETQLALSQANCFAALLLRPAAHGRPAQSAAGAAAFTCYRSLTLPGWPPPLPAAVCTGCGHMQLRRASERCVSSKDSCW